MLQVVALANTAGGRVCGDAGRTDAVGLCRHDSKSRASNNSMPKLLSETEAETERAFLVFVNEDESEDEYVEEALLFGSVQSGMLHGSPRKSHSAELLQIDHSTANLKTKVSTSLRDF